MKKIICLLLTFCMIISFAGCGNNNTASDSQYIKDKGTLTIGMTIFAPMNYYDKNNEFTGFETEFAKAVCEKIGVKADFVEINWDSKETELNSKNIDCIWNGMTITKEREENMAISTPYLKNRQVLIVREADVDKYKASLDGAKVTAEQGSAGEELAQSSDIFKSALFTAVDSQSKSVMEVASGVSDVSITDYIMALGTVGEGTDYKDLKIIDDYNFESEEYGIAFRKGSDFKDEVNKVISELVKDGTLLNIAKKYKLENLLIAK